MTLPPNEMPTSPIDRDWILRGSAFRRRGPGPLFRRSDRSVARLFIRPSHVRKRSILRLPASLTRNGPNAGHVVRAHATFESVQQEQDRSRSLLDVNTRVISSPSDVGIRLEAHVTQLGLAKELSPHRHRVGSGQPPCGTELISHNATLLAGPPGRGGRLVQPKPLANGRAKRGSADLVRSRSSVRRRAPIRERPSGSSPSAVSSRTSSIFRSAARRLGELRRFADRFGASSLVDRESRRFLDLGLQRSMHSDDWWLKRLTEEPGMLKQPLVRFGHRVSVGLDENSWREWLST